MIGFNNYQPLLYALTTRIASNKLIALPHQSFLPLINKVCPLQKCCDRPPDLSFSGTGIEIQLVSSECGCEMHGFIWGKIQSRNVGALVVVLL